MSMPGVQMPHWAPPASRNACWSGPRAAPPAGASPSTVRTSEPSTWQTGTRQRVDDRAVDEHGARAALPFPAALLGARSARGPRAGRRAAGACPGASTSTGSPLTVNRKAGQCAISAIRLGSAERLGVRAGVRTRVRALVDRRLDGGLDVTRPGQAGRRLGRRRRAQRREDPLRRRRQVVDPDADRVVDRGDDRRRPDVHRQLADALRAVRRRR